MKEIKSVDKNSSRALQLALNAHHGQFDLGGKPYKNHIIAVGENLKKMSEDDDTLAVAYLHDTLEDSETSIDRLEELFSKEIVEAVMALTKKPKEPYQIYLNRVKVNSMARIVKIADLQHNSDISRIKNPEKRDFKRLEKYIKAISFLEGED